MASYNEYLDDPVVDNSAPWYLQEVLRDAANGAAIAQGQAPLPAVAQAAPRQQQAQQQAAPAQDYVPYFGPYKPGVYEYLAEQGVDTAGEANAAINQPGFWDDYERAVDIAQRQQPSYNDAFWSNEQPAQDWSAPAQQQQQQQQQQQPEEWRAPMLAPQQQSYDWSAPAPAQQQPQQPGYFWEEWTQPSAGSSSAPPALAPILGQPATPETPEAQSGATPVDAEQNPVAPDWWSAPDTWLGRAQRSVLRPDATLWQRGAGLLSAVGEGLGVFGQGVENTLSTALAEAPGIGRGARTSFAQEVRDSATQFQQQLPEYRSPYVDELRAGGLLAPINAAQLSDGDLAAYAVRGIGYTGAANAKANNPQVAAARRVLAGESPEVAMRGAQKPAANAYADQLQLWDKQVQEYLSAQERIATVEAAQAWDDNPYLHSQATDRATFISQRAAQSREAAARFVNGTGTIPGNAQFWPELIGNIVLDPLNLPGAEFAGIFTKGKAAIADEAAAAARTVFDDAAQVQLDKITTGISGEMGVIEQAVAERAASSPIFRAIDKGFQKGRELFSYTPATQAKVQAGLAFKQVGQLTLDAETGMDAVATLRQFVDNPRALADTFGNVPLSIEAEAARPVVQGALEQLEKLPSMKAAVWNPIDFISEATPVLQDAANAVAGFDPTKPLPAWQRWAQAAKAWMSEFYLRTPGYIIRNAVGDTTVATMDGLRMFENYDQVLTDLREFGATTRRVAETMPGSTVTETTTALQDSGTGSKLANVPIIGAIQTKIGDIADAAEKQRYLRAYHSALVDAWGANWRPQLSDETYQLFANAGMEDVAEALEAGLARAKTGKQARAIIEEVLGATHPAERFYVTRYTERATDLSTAMATTIEKDVREMAKRGASAEEVARYFDGMIAKTRDDKASKLVDVGPVFTPRAYTEGAWVQDVEELQRELAAAQGKAGDLAQLVNRGQMTREEATQILLEEITTWREQTKRLDAARKSLREVFVQTPTTANPDDALSAINHAITYEMEQREAVRLVMDAERAKAWKVEKPDRALWDDYRAKRNAAWSEHVEQVVAEYGKVRAALGEINAGATGVLDKLGIERLGDRASKMLERARAAMSAEGLAEFDKGVAASRYAFDQAQNEAARQVQAMIRENPELAVDGFDILWSARHDADTAFQQAIGTQYKLLAQKDAEKITLKQYDELMRQAWEKAWAGATNRYTTFVEAQVRGVTNARAIIAQDLAKLGYKDAELARLTAGISDGSTKAEVAEILKTGRRPAPSATPEVDLAGASEKIAAPTYGPMQPPATVDEYLAGQELDVALTEAKRMRYTAERLINDDLLTSTGKARSKAAGAQITEAEKAVEQWDAIVRQLEQRAAFDAGDANAGAREFVQMSIRERGLREASDDIRAIAEASLPEEREAMLAELRAVVRERVSAKLELADDATTGLQRANEIMAEALGYAPDEWATKARTTYATGAKVPLVATNNGKRVAIRGLEFETEVDLARAMAKELGVELPELARERGASELVAAARATKKEMVDDLLALPVTNEGKPSSAVWDEFAAKHGITGDRRTVAELLREVAPAPATSGTPAAAAATSAVADESVVALSGYKGSKNYERPDTMAGIGDQVVHGSRGEFGRIVGIEGDQVRVRFSATDERLLPAGELKWVEAARGKTRQPAKIAATSGEEMTPEQLAKLDRLMEKYGDAQAPDIPALLTAHERQQVAALERIKAGMVAEWAQAINPAGLPAGVRQAIDTDMAELVPRLNETRAAAVSHAQARADFALLDYGLKRGFDTYAAAFAPYYYWGSRQGRNFAIRIAERPAILANYLKYKEQSEAENVRRGYRKRFEGGWEIPTPGGGAIFVDPTALLFPFAGLANTDMIDARQSKGTLASIYEGASAMGFRPAPYIDLPLRYSNLMVEAAPGTQGYDEQVAAYGAESIGSLIPQTGLIKGATAMAGIGGPGGVDIERPVRSALGLPEAGRFEAYTVARAVRDAAAVANAEAVRLGAPWNASPYLLAQALISQRDERGWVDLLNTATSEQLAAEFKVPKADAAAALQIVREAAAQAASDRGLSSIGSTVGGLMIKPLPVGERTAYDMQRLERAAGYNAATGVGSRADVDMVREKFPALAVGRAQYGTLPGESETMPMELYQRNERDALNAQFDALKDELLRRQPWDRAGAQQIEDMRQQALAKVQPDQAAAATDPNDWRAVYQQAATKAGAAPPDAATSGTAKPYRPRSIAGANPREAINIRREELLAQIAATMPQPGQFTAATSGTVDWDAYNAAVQRWQAGIQQTARQLPAVRQVLMQAERDAPGRGDQLAQFVDGITPQQVDAYRRRNDTPLEAMQRAYFELVYRPAWDAYAKARERGAPGGAAFGGTVGRVPQLNADQLVALVERRYPGQFTRQQLSTALAGINMPSAQQVQRLAMTPEQRAEAEKREAQAKASAARAAAGRQKRAAAQQQAAQEIGQFEQMMKGHYGAEAYAVYVQWQTADPITRQALARQHKQIREMDAVRFNYAKKYDGFKKYYRRSLEGEDDQEQGR